MDLRLEEPADHDAVAALHRAAFGRDVVAALATALRADIAERGGLSVVATADGTITGNIMISRSRLDAPRALLDVYVLSPVGVIPEYQKQGYGSAMIRYGLELAASTYIPLMFLEGDPGYYRRFGFVPAGDLGFRKPSLRIPDHAFQVYPLPAYESWMTGTLVYNDLFWEYDCVGLRET